MARCQHWVPGFFDEQNVKLLTDNCKLAIIYRTQCDVTLDKTISARLTFIITVLNKFAFIGICSYRFNNVWCHLCCELFVYVLQYSIMNLILFHINISIVVYFVDWFVMIAVNLVYDYLFVKLTWLQCTYLFIFCLMGMYNTHYWNKSFRT